MMRGQVATFAAAVSLACGVLCLPVMAIAETVDRDECSIAFWADMPTTQIGADGQQVDFYANIMNIGASPESVTIYMFKEIPSDWFADFCIGGCWFDSIRVELAPAVLEQIQLRVYVGLEDGAGRFELSFRAHSNPTCSDSYPFAVFKGIPTLLLVDDDGGATYEQDMEDALTANGWGWKSWDVDFEGSTPTPDEMAQHRIVFWNTAGTGGKGVGTPEEEALSPYLDGGGNLFLASQGYLNGLGGTPTAFCSGYLHVTGWTLDVGETAVQGEAGDPIGGGLSFTLSPPYANGIDRLDISSPASVAFITAAGTCGNHVTESGHGVVFLAFGFEGIPSGDQDVLVQRIMEYFLPPAGIEGPQDGVASGLSMPQASAQPNPWRPGCQIEFAIPGSGGAEMSLVDVKLYDLRGRLVRELWQGSLAAGEHRILFDARDDDGAELPTGVYFCRISADGVHSTTKVVVAR